jgi:hypothetical protein
MKKTKTPSAENIWGDDLNPSTLQPVEDKVQPTIDKTQQEEINKAFDEEYAKFNKPTQPISIGAGDFDVDGLMTDFPTATDLERFVYDQTGVTLNLKGRANKVKYETALAVLNGEDIDPVFLGGTNPYIEKADMVPTEELKPVPPRDRSIPHNDEVQNNFYSPFVPHPDPDMRAQDKKVDMVFKKYKNGMITYEILGPLEQKPIGEKLDKYGRTRPEIIKWIDPRTGEQVAIREDGSMTPRGKRLRAMMQAFKINKSNQWDVWIDRDFITLDGSAAHNPWELD